MDNNRVIVPKKWTKIC